MAYTFDQIFAADPSNPSNVAQNASITIFAVGDGTMTPLTITDPDGQPLANPIPVNANGFGSAFAHATLDRVAWAGGGFTGFFTSYEGMKAEAVAARTAAETAEAEAASAAATTVTTATVNGSGRLILTKADASTVDAGTVVGPIGQTGPAGLNGSNVLPTDTAIKEAIENPASATRVALNATNATESRRRFSLARFHRAAADGGMVAMIHYGHSVTEGSNAAQGQRWTDVLAANLRAKLQPAGIVGGAGYAASAWTYPTAQPANWTYTGTVTDSGNGLGLFGKNMTASSTATLTFTGTGIRVMGKSYPGGPSVGVTVDGVAQTAWNLNTAGIVDTNKNALYSGFTAGSHTIVLTFPGTAVFNGGQIHNGDETLGIVSYNAGHAGGKVTDISNWTTVIPDTIKSLTPSLITIEYGINEYRMNVTTASFNTDLRKAIGMVRAAVPNASVVLVSDYEPAPNGTPVATWAAYKTVMADAATALNCGLVDLSTVATLGPGGSGMNADMVHPNVAGHTAMAGAVSAYLTQDITV